MKAMLLLVTPRSRMASFFFCGTAGGALDIKPCVSLHLSARESALFRRLQVYCVSRIGKVHKQDCGPCVLVHLSARESAL